MLVLSRKPNQQIIIGDNIRVVVFAVNGDQVKLGLSAPRNVPIYRDDVRCKLSPDCHTDAKTCDETSDGSRHSQGEQRWCSPT